MKKKLERRSACGRSIDTDTCGVLARGNRAVLPIIQWTTLFYSFLLSLQPQSNQLLSARLRAICERDEELQEEFSSLLFSQREFF